MDSMRKKRIVIFGIFFSECIFWHFAGIFAAAHDVYVYLFVIFWTVVMCVTIVKANDVKKMNGVLSAIMVYSLFMFFVSANSMVPYYKMNPSNPVVNIFFFKRDAGIVLGSGGALEAFVCCIYLIILSKFFRTQ
ncbi:hypothetical protein [Nitratidesulfovibrio termitidis]|uniref:hypothetical protein n=1 Tax=Nitratidesulfovibrio termitidis TaxID=42252 RepID=UPI0012EC57FC|nr:hypothetical protein [Nitratidesulfovibrio termitidis]